MIPLHQLQKPRKPRTLQKLQKFLKLLRLQKFLKLPRLQMLPRLLRLLNRRPWKLRPQNRAMLLPQPMTHSLRVPQLWKRSLLKSQARQNPKMLVLWSPLRLKLLLLKNRQFQNLLPPQRTSKMKNQWKWLQLWTHRSRKRNQRGLGRAGKV